MSELGNLTKSNPASIQAHVQNSLYITWEVCSWWINVHYPPHFIHSHLCTKLGPSPHSALKSTPWTQDFLLCHSVNWICKSSASLVCFALEARKSISLIKYFTKDCKISFAIWRWPLFALEILQPDVWLSFLYTNLTFTQCCVLCGNVVCTKW